MLQKAASLACGFQDSELGQVTLYYANRPRSYRLYTMGTPFSCSLALSMKSIHRVRKVAKTLQIQLKLKGGGRHGPRRWLRR